MFLSIPTCALINIKNTLYAKLNTYKVIIKFDKTSPRKQSQNNNLNYLSI